MQLTEMLNTLSPIGLSVYSRLNHVRQTINALQANEQARYSELYIFSDGPKPGDEKKVLEVRRFLRSVDGFKKVHLIERAENNRVANNRGGMCMLLNLYGKMIFLEEDIVTAPSFLAFMNAALDRYRADPRVFAVNAYTPPIGIPEDYRSSVVLLPRFAAWGFGIWKETFDSIVMDITPAMYRDLRSDRQRIQRYCAGGDDAVTQLWLQSHGFINALDVMIDYTMFVKGRQYVVCPAQSLALSTGCDGTGEHWACATSKYDVEIEPTLKAVVIEDGIQPDERVIERLGNFYTLSFKGRVVRFAMDMGVFPRLRSLKRRLGRR